MTGYESKKAMAQDKLAQESVVERAWFTIDELNAWVDKKLAENPHWVMPAEEPERKEALAQQEPWPEEPFGHMAGGVQPPQRPWVGLTDDGIWTLHDSYPNPVEFARAIEAKLKERNA